ncbi:MAG TPA: hypothetical protein VFW66_01765 [Gemmatimonadales bacterium]|nr:hypothetical protein [Gemmatimonadales bacterium]
MRTYWIKILLGALGVFAVGMVLITAVRAGVERAHDVANSTDPIVVPLAFVPFRIDGRRLGTFDRIVFLRKTPGKLSGVKLRAQLADSVNADSLADCALLASIDTIAAGRHVQIQNADFHCLRDTAGTDAVRFGTLALEPGGLTLPLLVPRQFAAEFHQSDAAARAQASAEVTADSISEAADRMADSIEAATRRMADSMAGAHEHVADSIRQAMQPFVDSMRHRGQVLRDSLRAAARDH